MTTEQILNSVRHIKLGMMEAQVDVNRLLTEDYPGAEYDLALVLVQNYYKPLATKIDTVDMKERALSYAKWHATKRLTQELPGLVERSTMLILQEAQETGWYYDLEYETLEEVLASIYEDKQGMDEAYDWKFILDKLVPVAESAGIPAGMLAEASLQVKKLRGIVPAARELFHRMENDVITTTEAQETLHIWLEQVVDKTISYSTLKETTDVWRGRSVGRKKEVDGFKLMMPDGHWWAVIPTNGDGELAMLEQALRNRVRFDIRDVGWLAKSVVGVMKHDP